jgi:hypothetical protein
MLHDGVEIIQYIGGLVFLLYFFFECHFVKISKYWFPVIIQKPLQVFSLVVCGFVPRHFEFRAVILAHVSEVQQKKKQKIKKKI